MNNIEKVRQIAMAYVKTLNMDLESKLGELGLLMTDDRRLLEHIEVIESIMYEARKELRKGSCEAGYVREPYMGNMNKDDLIVEMAEKYGIK